MSFSSGSLLHYSYPCCYQSNLEFSLSIPTALLFAAVSASTTSTVAAAADVAGHIGHVGNIVAHAAVAHVPAVEDIAGAVVVLVQDF